MATSKGAAATQSKSKITEQLDAQLLAREEALGRIDSVGAAWKREIDRVDAKFKPLAEAEVATLAAIDEGLRDFLSKYRRTLTRRLSQTIVREHGEVKYRVLSKALDLPKNVKPIIARLKARRGGKKFLTFTVSLNKDALTQGSAEVLRDLRPLGVVVARHLHITVKSPQEDDPTTLVRRVYRERRP